MERRREHWFMRYHDWITEHDPITDHCECCYWDKTPGHLHCRSWTLAQLRKAFGMSRRPR